MPSAVRYTMRFMAAGCPVSTAANATDGGTVRDACAPASRSGRDAPDIRGAVHRPLSVGIIASARHALREPFAGGLEAHTAQLARGLRDRGHRVVVFASADSDPRLGVEPVCARATRLDLSEAARRDPSMLADAFMGEHHAYLHLMLRLRERGDLDVVHNNALHYLPVAMASTLSCPFVTTLHTPPTPWLESAHAAARERGAYVSVSQANAAAWQATVPDCAVIPNAVDTETWRPRPGPVLDRAVWMGRIVPEKAPHLALRAAHLAGLPLDIAGPVHDREYHETCVAPLLRPVDRLLGHRTSAELAKLVAARAVCLVTPAWDEPFGLVVAEALACGTPVAAFARGALPELLDARTGALAAPGDPAALADAIARARRCDRAHCAREAARRWTVDAMVRRYEDCYRGL